MASVLPRGLGVVLAETEVHVWGRGATVRGGDVGDAYHVLERREGGLAVGDLGNAS